MMGYGQSILPAIILYLNRKVTQKIEWIFPTELINECLKFVGFLPFTKMLKSFEQESLYQLLFDHHNKLQTPSPFIDKYHVKYFDLLYKSSRTKKQETY